MNDMIDLVRKVIKHSINHFRAVVDAIAFRFDMLVPDKLYLERKYRRLMGEEINLDSPVTFNEKINWLKLNDRNPLYTELADKIEVKRYVRENFKEIMTIPTLAIYSKPDQIEYESLPDKFVIKCSHDSGSIIACRNKDLFDKRRTENELNRLIRRKYYYYSREWPYKNIKPRLLIEPMMAENLYDYKVHCFSGQPRFIEIIGDRDLEAHKGRVSFYDFDWNRLNWSFGDYPFFEKSLIRPVILEDMYLAAQKMSQGFAYIRLDFYIIDNTLYFGEYTFTPSAGFNTYNAQWTKEKDIELGNLIDLSLVKRSQE